MIDLVGTWNDDIANTYQYVHKKGDRLFSETHLTHKPIGNRHFLNTAGPLYDEDGSVVGAIETIHDITERRAAEAAVTELHATTQKNLAFIEAMLSAIPTPVFFKDTEGRYLGCNQAFGDLMGVTSEQIQGKTVHELWPGEKADLYHQKDLELIRHPGRQTYEYSVSDKNGCERQVIFAKDLFYDDKGELAGIVGAFTDITELRHAEANLRLMEHVIRNSPAVLFRWHATENWPVEYVTENVGQFGYSKQELLSGEVPFSAMVHPDDLPRVADEVMKYTRRGVIDFKQEYRIVTKSGRVRWVDDRTMIERDASGNITHYQGVVLDITDQKMAQEDVHKRQLFLESVLYHAPDAVVTLDADQRVIDWNPGAEKIFGYSRDDALGRELDGLVSRNNANKEAAQKTRRLLRGERVDGFETVRHRKDGTPVNVIVAGSPIIIDGTLTGVVAMYTDITALKQAENEVRRNERMLRRIMDIVPSMIFVKNAQGRFLMANQAVADSYNMTVEALQGKLHEAIHPDPDQLERMLAEDRKVIESGQRLTVASESYRDSTGSTRWLEVVKVHGDAEEFGEPVVVGLATDITERRAAEARIQESEKRYRTMFENTGTGTVLSEADTTLSMVNSEFASMVGYTREAIEGKMSWTRFIDPQDVERMMTYFTNRRKDPSSTPTQWECGLVDRKGHVKRMLVKVRLIPGTQISIGSFLDISDRKRAEEALVEANRMLRLVLDTIPVRVFWKDLECRYLGCNQAFAADAGLSSPASLIGKDDYEMTWRDQADLYRSDDQAVMASGQARIDYEEPQTTPAGQTIWLQTGKVPMRDIHENIIGVLGTYQDITERKHAMEELRRLRNYLSNIINSMPSVLVGVDLEGRVTQWNKQAELATGMTFDKARSQPLTVVFPRLMDAMARIQSAIKDRRVLRDPKVPRHSDGETRFEDITIFPLVANGVEGAVIRVDDVTERVRLEEMMIQSEKMLSIGGLAAGMAHEINNPLAGILQNTAVLENRLFGDLPANQKAADAAGISMTAMQHYLDLRKLPTMLDNIRASGNRAAAIVKNMLSFARKSDRIVSSHDLGDLLDQTLELARTDYNMKKRYDFKRIHITREYDRGVAPVPCEASKLQQVFLNILKNGAEAMTEGDGGPAQPAFILRVKDDGLWVRVEIEDNGPGMDQETHRRIFEPFFTTKPVGEGTGLGLSVSYFIITENHHGKMDVFSTDGEGTRFVIRLAKAGRTAQG
jgi:PAS domain S-box-containing protein